MAKSLILEGIVQGVACRHYCSQVARRMRLNGSATNLQDGTVRVTLDTDDDTLARNYAEALRTNSFGFTFFGRITGIRIENYSGPIRGDYNF